MQFLDFEKPIEELYIQLQKLKEMSAKNQLIDMSKSIQELEETIVATKAQIYKNLTPWQR
ncbi:MAG: acetyl-CoA carboxylase carboxyl transferase subunit alpha, partial [Bacteroidia bacterium]